MDKPKRWTAWRLSRYENGELKEDVDASLTNGVDVNLADEMDAYIAEREDYLTDLARRAMDFMNNTQLTLVGESMKLYLEFKRLAEGGE